MDIPHVVGQLRSHGFVVIEHAVSAALLARLDAHCTAATAGDFVPAGIGRGVDWTHDAAVRGDVVSWLDDDRPADHSYLQVMEELRLVLNAELFLGLLDYEGHYAIYETGAHYAKHLDALTGRTNRLLSTVVYLNGDWAPADGGELVLYRASDQSVLVRILPQPGRMVLFLSDAFPHEVLVATKLRHSIAGWFRGRLQMQRAHPV